MYRNGRPEEDHCPPEEFLFRRYLREHWVGGQFSGVGLRFAEDSGISVSRARFSEPEDTLFSQTGEFNGWGVLEFKVMDVPPEIEVLHVAFSFFMRHVPYDDNYSHSEIWSSDTRVPTGTYVQPTPAVRKQFRAIIGQRMRVRIESAI